MKKLYLLIFLLAVSISLFADDIYLIDNTVQTVTVTDVTKKNIEFIASDKSNRKFQREDVEKIVYSNGTDVEFFDRIYMKDGSILKGKITKKSKEYIGYNPAGNQYFAEMETSGIIKVLYDSGKVENFSKTADTDLVYLKDGKKMKAMEVVINLKNVEFYDEENNKQLYTLDMIKKINYGGKTVYADESLPAKDKDIIKTNDGIKSLNSFLEIETGMNGYAGTGIRFDLLLRDNISLNGAAGYSLWGNRISCALRYYPDYPYGLASSLGVSFNTGGNISSMKLNTQDTTGENIYKETIELKANPVACINGSLLYFFNICGNDRIYIETGYSYTLQKGKYSYKTKTGRELTKESEKKLANDLKLTAPGGFMISVGYAFAL